MSAVAYDVECWGNDKNTAIINFHLRTTTVNVYLIMLLLVSLELLTSLIIIFANECLYNYVADSFHTKKLCSRLSSSEVTFYMENGHLAFSSSL